MTIALDDPMWVPREARTTDRSFWAFAAVLAAAAGAGVAIFLLVRRWLRQRH